MSAAPRPVASRRASGQTSAALAAAAPQITARDRWLLAMLHEHTVLTTTHLARLGWAAGLRSTQLRLATLHQLGVVDRFRPHRPLGSAPWHLVLGPLGAHILAAEYGADLAALGWRRERSLAVAYRLSLAHDTATTDLVCDLAADPSVCLHTWWSPARCHRHLGHHARPDTYLALTTGAPTSTGVSTRTATGHPYAVAGGVPDGGPGRVWEMFVEFDMGTTALRVLAAKLRGYHDLADEYACAVPVGFWIARPGREPEARQALAAAHRLLARPQLVPVLTASPAPGGPPPSGPRPSRDRTIPAAPARHEDSAHTLGGAAGRVWLPLHHPPGQTPRRWRLADLARPARPAALAALTTHPDQPDAINGVTGIDGGSPDGHVTRGPSRTGLLDLPAPPPRPPHLERRAQTRQRGALRTVRRPS